jgi:hypothetical protein
VKQDARVEIAVATFEAEVQTPGTRAAVSVGKCADGGARTDPITHLRRAINGFIGGAEVTVLNDNDRPICHRTNENDDTGAY